MLDVINALRHWQPRGEPIAIATVVRTWGSAPRQAGAKLAVTASGSITGSVSGGCIEGAVFEACQAVIAIGHARLLHFGVADETAWDVGLACGGAITVFVQRFDLHDELLIRTVTATEPVAAVTLIALPSSTHNLMIGTRMLVWADGRSAGSLGSTHLDTALTPLVRASLLIGETRVVEVPVFAGSESAATLFIESFVPPPTLFIVGAVHIAVALVTLAKTLGFRTVVIDARPAFATVERFAHADELIIAWPDEALAGRLNQYSYVAVLTHDPKLDDPALTIALASNARYIGALGSPSTHAKRKRRFHEAGFSDAQLGRIHAPIGLPIGARNAEEIALSIIAEVVKTRRNAG